MDTIAAISTPRGTGGIGVIRISGEAAIEIGDRVFRGVDGKNLSELKGYCTKFGRIVENEEAVDEVIAAVFRGPHSYTGEDVVEISCHGGIFITSEILRIIISAGAVPAKPGEFTQRAFLNNKMSLTQAESVMEIISAKSKLAAGIAFAAKNGDLQKRISSVKDILLNSLSTLLANIDYPEDDIPQIDINLLKAQLSEAALKNQKLIESSRAGRIIKEGVVTAIVGKPNVGKSTLMNLLSGCERSIVTDIPGTTRDIIEETVTVGDIPLLLSDTAGIREPGDEIEKIGIQRAKDRINSSELIIAVFDGSKDLSKEDISILDDFKGNKNLIVILNKLDSGLKVNEQIIKRYTEHIVKMSAKSGEGREEFEKVIYRALDDLEKGGAEPAMFNERIFSGLKNSLEYIKEAMSVLDSGIYYDIASHSIENAVKELGLVLGEGAGEDLAGEIFSKFCVGK